MSEQIKPVESYALTLTRAIFDLGKDPRGECSRIQFMIGDWPEEQDGGGMNFDAMVRFIEIHQNETVQQLQRENAKLLEKNGELALIATNGAVMAGMANDTIKQLSADLAMLRLENNTKDKLLDDAQQELAAAKQQLAEVEWQSIETAPKDGTHILLMSRKGRVADGVWVPVKSENGYWVWPLVKQEPTHWMPMPGYRTRRPVGING